MSAAVVSRAPSGFVLVFAAAVLWGLIGLFTRAVLDAGVGALEIAFWRALLAGGAFALHALAIGRLKVGRRSDLAAMAAFALVGVTLFYGSLSLAIESGGISLAFVLLYTAPAFVAVLAWPLLGERLSPFKASLVGLALLGVLLVALAGDGASGVRVTPISLTWGLLAGLSYASYYLFGKWILARYATVTIYAVVLPIGAIGLLPFVAFTPKGATVWLLLVSLSLVSTYLAYLLYYTGLRTVEASRAVLVATIEPVVAASLAAAIYGERLGPLGVAGAALILVAAGAAARRPWGRRSRTLGDEAPPSASPPVEGRGP
ncbi:DMT family transporter [soil metagenome]